MPYAPRKRQLKLKWNVVSALLVLFILIAYLLVHTFFQKTETEPQRFSICGLSPEETATKLQTQAAETFALNDYLYYGESLNLYEETYAPANTDTLAGKSLELHDICSDVSTTMIIQNTVDQKISLNELEPGFYDVSVLDRQIKKRLIFHEALSENSFTTVSRNGRVHQITLIADKDLLKKDHSISWDQHYLFIQVEEVAPSLEDIDVLIDPYGMNLDVTYTPDVGGTANGLNENEEMFAAAQLMKQELESYGLRVEITKQDVNESGQAYGEAGRLSKGYVKNARYYLFLRFSQNELNTNIRGFEVQHSAYSSPILARKITYNLEKNLEMPLCSVNSTTDAGIVKSFLTKGQLDSQLIYDMNLYLRESGGRATLAGKYSENAQKENAGFMNANGMQGLEIDFLYMTNADDAQLWKDNKETIIKETAKAFAQGINVLENN